MELLIHQQCKICGEWHDGQPIKKINPPVLSILPGVKYMAGAKYNILYIHNKPY